MEDENVTQNAWRSTPNGTKRQKWREIVIDLDVERKIDMMALSVELKAWLWTPTRRHRLWTSNWRCGPERQTREERALNVETKTWLWTPNWTQTNKMTTNRYRRGPDSKIKLKQIGRWLIDINVTPKRKPTWKMMIDRYRCGSDSKTQTDKMMTDQYRCDSDSKTQTDKMMTNRYRCGPDSN